MELKYCDMDVDSLTFAQMECRVASLCRPFHYRCVLVLGREIHGLHLTNYVLPTTSYHFILPLRVDKTGGYTYFINDIHGNICSMNRTIKSHMETMNGLLIETYPIVLSTIHFQFPLAIDWKPL